jgi:MFS family permease
MLTAAAQGEVRLILLRLLLGAAEAGFAPAMIVLIGLWFPASKRAGAISLMAVAVLPAGFGTPLSAIIMTSMEGLLGLPGWGWMFLMTGLPPVVLGFVFYKVIRNGPSEATFLDAAEKRWLTTQLDKYHGALGGTAANPFRRGVLNPRVAFLVVMYILFAFSLFGFQFFIPQMLQQLGLSTIAIGWVAALPPLLALGPTLWWSRHFDRTGERVRHYAAAAATAGIGFLIAGFSMSTPADRDHRLLHRRDRPLHLHSPAAHHPIDVPHRGGVRGRDRRDQRVRQHRRLHRSAGHRDHPRGDRELHHCRVRAQREHLQRRPPRAGLLRVAAPSGAGNTTAGDARPRLIGRTAGRTPHARR